MPIPGTDVPGDVQIVGRVASDVPGDWLVTVNLWYTDTDLFTTPPDNVVVITVTAANEHDADILATQWAYNQLILHNDLGYDDGSGYDDSDNGDDDGNDDGDGDDDGGDDGGDDGDGLSLCLARGTLVRMATGSLQRIETIRPNDSVLSREQASGDLGPQRVLRNRRIGVSRFVGLKLSSGAILYTSERQPLIVEGGGSVKAKDITEKLALRSSAKQPISVHSRATLQYQGLKRSVHWLVTEHKRPLLLKDDLEVSSNPKEKN